MQKKYDDVEKILSIVRETYDKEQYRYGHIPKTASEAFTNGYSYELYKILSLVFPCSALIMKVDSCFCAIYIDHNIYDINGKVDESNFFYNKQKLSNYCGVLPYELKQKIIENIKEQNIIYKI